MSLDARVRREVGAFCLDVDLRVETGEIVAIVGPNGAGKTTLLLAIAGLLPLDGARVVLDGELLDDGVARVPPERRRIGIVFQDYLLFPHMSALENVAFGLRCRGMPGREARRRAADWLDRLRVGGLEHARPDTFSGGEAQRVALARALAVEPRLLLLDEPLSALDASTRLEVRRELRRVLGSFEGTRLLVTHDPFEAVALADRLVVLEEGRVVQTGSPAEVTARPRSPFVADLVGVNLLSGTASQGIVLLSYGGRLAAPSAVAGDVYAVIHPRAVALHLAPPEGTPRNVWHGRVDTIDMEGDRARVRVLGEPGLVAEVTPASVDELRLAPGVPVWLSVKATEVTVFPR